MCRSATIRMGSRPAPPRTEAAEKHKAEAEKLKTYECLPGKRKERDEERCNANHNKYCANGPSDYNVCSHELPEPGPPLAVAEKFNKRRQDGKRDDECCDRQEIAVGAGNGTPEKIPCKRHPDCPKYGTHAVIDKEGAVAHDAHACEDWCEGADHRHEAREDKRLPAVALVEAARPFEVPRIK